MSDKVGEIQFGHNPNVHSIDLVIWCALSMLENISNGCIDGKGGVAI